MRAVRQTFSTPLARIAVAILLLVVLVSLFGEWLRPYSPVAQDTNALFGDPSTQHWLGTDYLGRDTLSRPHRWRPPDL